MSWNISSSATLKAVVQSCRQSLGSEANGQAGSDYPTAVTPSVTSSTMVLRRNIGHCYTDSVTIMAAIGRRARAPWACYTRTHATAPAPHVASHVFEAAGAHHRMMFDFT